METKKLYERIFLRTGIIILLILFFANLAAPLFDALLPIILALLLVSIITPLINKIDDALPIKNKAVSYIVGTVILIIFLILFLWIFQTVILQINGLIGNIMRNWSTIVSSTNDLIVKANSSIDVLPDVVNNAIHSGLNSLFKFLQDLQADAINITLNFTTAFINTSSNAIFFTITFVVAFYIILGEINKARRKYHEVLEDDSIANISLFRTVFVNSTWNYIKAQLKLAVLCGILMAIGLKIIGQEYFIPIAMILGFFDLLPMIGPVIILIPWSVIELFMFNNTPKAIGLLIMLMVWEGLRQALAPKVIGESADIHPILSVIALYAGLRLWGVKGAIIAPIFMIFIVGLIRSGLLDNWIFDYKQFIIYVKDLLDIGKRKLKVPADEN